MPTLGFSSRFSGEEKRSKADPPNPRITNIRHRESRLVGNVAIHFSVCTPDIGEPSYVRMACAIALDAARQFLPAAAIKRRTFVCFPVQFIYLHVLCWLILQGSFTFPPQQMPHASTDIPICSLEYRDDKPRLTCARWSYELWDFAGLDGRIGLMLRERLLCRFYSNSVAMLLGVTKKYFYKNKIYKSNDQLTEIWIVLTTKKM